MTGRKKKPAARIKPCKKKRMDPIVSATDRSENSPVRLNKVKRVMRLLAEGNFNIDSDRIAEVMLGKNKKNFY
jgi:anti-sigma28 factor (negative regulator of flagellin synthesis)